MNLKRKALTLLLCLLSVPALAGDIAIYSLTPSWDAKNRILYVTTHQSFECCEGSYPYFLQVYSIANHQAAEFGLFHPEGSELLSEKALEGFESRTTNILWHIKRNTEPLPAYKISKSVEKKIVKDCSNRYFNTMEEKLVEPWKNACSIELGHDLNLECQNTYHELGRKRSVQCHVTHQQKPILSVTQKEAAGLYGLELFQIPNDEGWIGLFKFSDPFHTPVLGPQPTVVTGFAAPTLDKSAPIATMDPDLKKKLDALGKWRIQLKKFNAAFYSY